MREVQLHDERDLAGEFLGVLLSEPDLHHDAIESALNGKLEDVARICGRRISEEIPRTMFKPLIIRQQQRGTVAQSGTGKDPVQAGSLA
jgi:hypothetical protein